MKFLAIALIFAVSTAQAEWKTETDLGLVSQSGNTKQDNTLLKTKLTKESGKNAYTVHGQYINSAGTVTENGTSVDVRLAESAQAGLKFTRTVSDKLGVFSAALWEKNHFAGFENRYSGDLGLKYSFTKTETFYLFNETGYRYRAQYASVVGPGQGDKVEAHFGRVYFEMGKNLNATSKFKLWVETLVDSEDSENIEVNFEPSIDVAIGEFFSSEKPARVSLKVAYKGMYDNVPAIDGLKKFDSILSTGIKVVY